MAEPDRLPGTRVPDGVKRPRALDPGEYMREPHTGFWFVRPPAPGYLQALNTATHPVTIEGRDAPDAGEAPISVPALIEQAGGKWRLEGGTWHPVPPSPPELA